MWRWRWWPETSTGLAQFCGNGIRKYENVNSRFKADAMTSATNAARNEHRTSLQRKPSIVGDQIARFTATPGDWDRAQIRRIDCLVCSRKEFGGF